MALFDFQQHIQEFDKKRRHIQDPRREGTEEHETQPRHRAAFWLPEFLSERTGSSSELRYLPSDFQRRSLKCFALISEALMVLFAIEDLRRITLANSCFTFKAERGDRMGFIANYNNSVYNKRDMDDYNVLRSHARESHSTQSSLMHYALLALISSSSNSLSELWKRIALLGWWSCPIKA